MPADTGGGFHVLDARQTDFDYVQTLDRRKDSFTPWSAQYFIAKTVQGDEYVVLLANKVAAGPFASVAEAVKARDGLPPRG